MRWLLLVVGTLLLVGGGCGLLGHGRTYDPPGADEDERLRRALEESYQVDLDRDPEAALCRGERADLTTWTRRSQAFAEEERQRLTAERERLGSDFDRGDLGLEARLARRAREFEIERRLARLDFALQLAVLPDALAVFEDAGRFLREVQPLRSAEEATLWIARLRALRERFAESATLLRRALTAGIYPSLPALERARATGAEAWMAELLDHFELRLASAGRVDPTRRAALLAAARSAFTESVLPARQQVEEALAAFEPYALPDGGLWRLPEGSRLYANLAAERGAGGLNAADLHTLGLGEVERVAEELRALMERGESAESLDGFLDRIRAEREPGTQLDEQRRAALLERASTRLAELANELRSVVLEPEPPELVLRLARPGELARPGDELALRELPEDRHALEVVLDASHPALLQDACLGLLLRGRVVPGEALARRSAGRGWPFARSLTCAGSEPGCQGWGAYAEGLQRELGESPSLADELETQLAAFARAALLVADTGLHSKRWSHARASEYLLRHSAWSSARCGAAVDDLERHPAASLSAVALSRKIVELRTRATRRLGPRLDLREFHGVVLEALSLPAPLVDNRIEAWIAAEMP